MKWQGVAYRAHNPRWSWTPLSGDGAKFHGGRFNPKGVPALYLSVVLETAILEANQGLQRFPPLTLVAYEVDCEDIVDLTDSRELRRLRIKPRDLACGWKAMAERGQTPPTWSLAKRLIDAGVAGVLVPSFAKGAREADRNLVLWDWADTPPHCLEVIDIEGRLPKNDRSWRR